MVGDPELSSDLEEEANEGSVPQAVFLGYLKFSLSSGSLLLKCLIQQLPICFIFCGILLL